MTHLVLSRLTAVVGNEVGLAQVSVGSGRRRPHWTVGMRMRRVPIRPVGRGGRQFGEIWILLKGMKKSAAKRGSKKAGLWICQMWGSACEGTWAHVWLALIEQAPFPS